MPAKDQATYWKNRVVKRKVRGKVSDHYYAQIQVRGQREWINLNTGNLQSAAQEAAKAYFKIASEGWDAFRPKKDESEDITVGEYIAAAQKYCPIKTSTLNTYATKFRRLVAELEKLNKDQSRYNPKKVSEWIDRVDTVKLDKITDQRIKAWHVAYLKLKEKEGPVPYERAKTTAISILRNSKSLFGRNILDSLPFELKKIPLSGIRPPAYPKNRFSPEATLANLRTQAHELKGDIYIIFLLALGAGLRRGEIDRLRWTDVDEDAGTIRVTTTEDGSTKSLDSQRTVFIGQALKDALRDHRDSLQGFHVVCPNAKLPKKRKAKAYRCHAVFQELAKWLRDQGITKHQPLHHLRGIFGDELAKSAGIYAASSQLGHSDIGTTRSYYAAGESQTPLEL